jgi:predicted alpha/beta-hydrolase family hydrolase
VSRSPREPFLDRADGAPDVRGVVHRPASPNGDGLVLTHGAGSTADAPLLVALADAFAARGTTVLRCDLPFRQGKPTGPPSPRAAPMDRAGIRRAVVALRGLGATRVFAGGHSYGGRQTTMLVADEPDLVVALLLLAYPLHPPTRPGQLRTAHFPRIRTPAMFVHGTTDPFGSIEDLRPAVALIPAPTSVLRVDGAGHDLARGRRAVNGSPFPDAVVAEFGRLCYLATGRSSRLPHSAHERS